MAGGIKELKARFTADASVMRRVFREIQQEAGRLGPAVQRSTQVANRSFDGLNTNAGRLRSALREAGNVPAFDELNRSAEQAQREIEQTGRVSTETMNRLETAVSGAGGHFDSLGADARQGFSDVETIIRAVQDDIQGLGNTDMDQLRAEIERVQREMQALEDAARQAEQQLDDVDGGGLDEAADSAENAGNQLGELSGGAGGKGGILAGVAGGFALVTGAVAAFAGAAVSVYGFVKSSDELRKATNSLQVQTGATTEEMEGMRQELINIYGNNFGESYQDIADAMAQVGGATQLTGEMLQEATERSLLLRDSFGWEVPEQMNAVRTMMTEFGYEAEEAYTILAQGQQMGINGAEDLLDTFNEYSGAFSDLGFTGATALDAIAASVDAGARNTDVAADALNEFATRIMDGSDLTRESLQNAGLDADRIIGMFKKGGPEAAKAFGEVTTAIGNIGDKAYQEQTAVGLFGTLAEDAGVKTVLALGNAEEQADETADTLDKMNEVKYDTISEAISGVGRKMVAHILIPLQDRIMPGVNKSINAFTGMIGTAAEALGAFIKGDESAQDVLMSYGLDPAQFQPVINGIDRLQDGFARFKKTAGENLRVIGGAIKSALVDAWPVVLSTLTTAMNFISANLRAITGFWQRNGETISSTLRKIADTIKNVLIAIWPSVRAAISAVVGFIGDSVRKIAKFWEENGAQIMEAVSNVFNGIMAVIKFVMPAVLAIIRMVWGNIKGVITGALDIIMGVVKIFSGLFTGDFKKMWEGIKQLFKGAVVFVWNFIQLMFYGKILSGAKAFVLSFRTFFVEMWKAVVKLFQGNVTAAWNIIRAAWSTIYNGTKSTFTNVLNFFKNTWASIKSITSGLITAMRTIFSNGFQALRNKAVDIFLNLYRTLSGTMTNIRTGISNGIRRTVDFARNSWNTFKTNTSQAFRDVYNTIKGRFTDIVNAAKELPGRIGEGIRLMASKVTSGVTSLINSMARTLGKGINGVISGINSVLDKIGVNTEIKKWKVPQWAKGTPKGGHPGGLAIVNDGTGDNAGPELIRLPDGTVTMLKGRNIMTNMPEGTQVLSAKNTRALLKESAYEYAIGTDLFQGVKNIGSKVVSGAKKVGSKVAAGASKVKDWAVDVFDYISNPSGLLDLAFKALGIKKPEGGTFTGDMAVGAWNQVKKGAVSYIKEKLKGFGLTGSGVTVMGGNGGGFGAPYRLTSRPGPRNTGIPGASTFHKGWDWAAPIGTPIPSVTDGVGHRTGWHPLSGNFVEVRDASGKVHRYQHNSRNIMKVGQQVKKGQTIALVGNTGVGSGAHLHYEVKGYEDGGIIDGRLGAQLAWLTEGGFAESVISHDPSKRTSQFDIWNKTGDMLGFNQAAAGVGPEALALLNRIAKAVEMGHVLHMDAQMVAEILRDPMTKLQELDGEIRNIYKK